MASNTGRGIKLLQAIDKVKKDSYWVCVGVKLKKLKSAAKIKKCRVVTTPPRGLSRVKHKA